MKYFRNVLNGQPMSFPAWVKTLTQAESDNMTKWLFDKTSPFYNQALKHFANTFEEVYQRVYDGRFGIIE